MSKAKMFRGRFAKSGFFGVKGDIIHLSNDVLNNSIEDAVGIPIYMNHNEDGRTYGHVTNVYKDGDSDWYNADMIITDDNMIAALDSRDNSGFKLSNGYRSKANDGNFRKDGIDYRHEISEIEWKELTLTKNPRYQDAVILNCDDAEEQDSDGIIAVEMVDLDSAKVSEFNENVKNEDDSMGKHTIDGVDYDESYLKEALSQYENAGKSFFGRFADRLKGEDKVIENEEDISEAQEEPKAEEPKEPVAEEKEDSKADAEDEAKAEPEDEAEEEAVKEEQEESEKDISNSDDAEKEQSLETAKKTKDALVSGEKFAKKTYSFKPRTY